MSFTEIGLIMFVALILFGPEDLPVIARTLGKIVFQVRKLINEVTREFQQAIDTPNNVINELLKDNPTKESTSAPDKDSASQKEIETEELLTYETETKSPELNDNPSNTNPLADLPSDIVSYSKDKQAGE